MPALRDLQMAFVGGLLGGEAHDVVDLIVPRGMTPQARFEVYRNNVFHNYREALRDVYPVVERLVGEDFFGHVARRYIPSLPSRHGNLHRYGADFGDFLDGFEPAAGLPYLGDVARLEWLVHESFHAADHPGLDPRRLAELAAECLPELCFVLHPACRLLESRFPVQRIWEINQPGAPEQAINLDEGGARLLVRRSGHAVEIESLAAPEYALLSALRRGSALRDALVVALAVGPLDFGAFLARRVAHATVVGWASAAA
jgi:hypothetical protein